MTGTAPRRLRKPAPAEESSIYDGRRLLGFIAPQGKGFLARGAGGRTIGKFPSQQLAMRAISTLDRADRRRDEAARELQMTGASQ